MRMYLQVFATPPLISHTLTLCEGDFEKSCWAARKSFGKLLVLPKVSLRGRLDDGLTRTKRLHQALAPIPGFPRGPDPARFMGVQRKPSHAMAFPG